MQEDPGWEHHLETLTEAFHLQIRAHHQLHHLEEVRRIGITTAKLLEESHQRAASVPKDFWIRSHNLGAQLYFAGHYDLAIPQFRHALALSGRTAHTHLWLAASLWARTKDRGEVLPLLASATHLYAGGKPWDQYRALPEFEDVRDDPQFLQAARGFHCE